MTNPDFRVCIVGAGPGGLSLARTFTALGIPFDIFERHSDVGGLWDASNPGTPLYDSAHFISSKTQSHYVGFPMPDDYPDYPSGKQIHAYMQSFARAYGLYDLIQFNTSVENAAYDGKGWDVTLSTGATKRYSDLICVTGTNWHAALPSYPGTFDGEAIHSSAYHHLDQFKGRRVLVVGAGNSGCDIACDAAHVADAAFISLRRGYHFVPKHIFGIPADVFAHNGPHLPMWLSQRIFGVMMRIINGDLTRLGLPKPDHKVFETHPIVNSQLLHYLSHGDIKAKPDIARLDGDGVVFKDGSRESVDLIVYATGYTWKIPYVDPAQFTWKGGRPDLYMNLFSRENPHLYALGYMETNGGAYKLFDNMSDLIARALLASRDAPADFTTFRRTVESDQPDLTGGIHFVASDRHATYVEIDAYTEQMKRLRKKMGWPDLSASQYDRVRAAGLAQAAE